MGVLPRMKELGYHVRELKYVDEAARRRAGMDYDRFARVVDGRLLSIMRPDLELALREQVADTVEIRFWCSITEIENSSERVRITLTDGSVLDADLLVGADRAVAAGGGREAGDRTQWHRVVPALLSTAALAAQS